MHKKEILVKLGGQGRVCQQGMPAEHMDDPAIISSSLMFLQKVDCRGRPPCLPELLFQEEIFTASPVPLPSTVRSK